MGQDVMGPAPLSQFGYSVSLSSDGKRLVGVPQFGKDPSEVYGMVQVYNVDGTVWVQIGKDPVWEAPDDRIGSSISADNLGVKVVVGAPLVDTVAGGDPGESRAFFLEENDLSAQTEHGLPSEFNYIQGESLLQLGSHVVAHCTGAIFASGGRDCDVQLWHYVSEAKAEIPFNQFPGIHPIIVNSFSGYHGHAQFECDIGMDCKDILTWIASREKQGGRAGISLIRGFDSTLIDNVAMTEAFPGPCDIAWFGEGPSVAMSGLGHRLAIGYESARFNGAFRSEINIYDYIAL